MLEYMNSVAVLRQFDEEKQLGEPKYWASKTDGSYITYENLIMDCQWMKRKGITEQLQSHDGRVFKKKVVQEKTFQDVT